MSPTPLPRADFDKGRRSAGCARSHSSCVPSGTMVRVSETSTVEPMSEARPGHTHLLLILLPTHNIPGSVKETRRPRLRSKLCRANTSGGSCLSPFSSASLSDNVLWFRAFPSWMKRGRRGSMDGGGSRGCSFSFSFSILLNNVFG